MRSFPASSSGRSFGSREPEWARSNLSGRFRAISSVGRCRGRWGRPWCFSWSRSSPARSSGGQAIRRPNRGLAACVRRVIAADLCGAFMKNGGGARLLADKKNARPAEADRAFRQGERRWTQSMGGERLDISEEMANPPPLRNPMTCRHYGGPREVVNHDLGSISIHLKAAQKQGFLSL